MEVVRADMTHTEAFTGKAVLITGGMGFIGSHLARQLVGAGAKVTVVDSMIPEYGGNLFNLDAVKGKLVVNISDIRDKHSLKYLVRGQDYLFNLAGQTSHLDSMENPHIDLDINCSSQLTLLEACRRHNPAVKIVFASTRQIYGKPDYLPVDEEHPLRPIDVNGINKMAGERYHLLYSDLYGIRACALRLTNTIGPHMRVRDARQTFLGLWVRHLVEGQPFEVWGGDQLRDFTYVDDAVDAFLLAAAREEANGRVFNLGGDRPIRLRDLAELLIKIHGGGDYVVKDFPPDRRRIDIGDYYADCHRIASVLGWTPKTPLEEALARTLSFYREHLPRYL